MQSPPELGISTEDWAQTPAALRVLVVTLWTQLQAASAQLQPSLAQVQQVEALRAQVTLLEAEVARLREQLGKNSRNSSLPPSSDPPSLPPLRKSPSGAKPGGQPGHPGHGRSLKPPEEITAVELKPVACVHCGALLLGEDPHPQRHQVTELPHLEPVVTEYRKHRLTCQSCGGKTEAEWPKQMPSGNFGPRLCATVGYLTGRLGISQRDVQEFLEALTHAGLSLGSIPALQERVSSALAESVRELQEYVQAQPVANVDETPWPECGRGRWAWVAVTPQATLFRIYPGRGAAQLQQLLGEDFKGLVGSDRMGAYNGLSRRQLCWAHLLRDFTAFVCRGGDSERLGKALLALAAETFEPWFRVRDGTLSREAFQARMEPIQKAVGQLLREGCRDHDGTSNTCAKLLKVEEALWSFVRLPGVEPTNNGAERALRRLVLWRRRSFGTQSERGSRFVERVMSVVTTLRQQNRDVLDYLTEACAASCRGDRAPTLLPPHALASAA